jgi:adhesin transport system membrane fusion protein
MALQKIKQYLQDKYKKFREALPVWLSTFHKKAKESSERCNIKFLQGLTWWEKKTDPAESFMADTGARHAQGASLFAHLALWLTLLFMVIMLVWAKLAVLDEVTVGEGKVIPASQVQVIQNLEGGIIKKIFVKESDVVQTGQILMQLDDTKFNSDYHEAQLKGYALEAKIGRLNSVINDVPFVVSQELKQKAPDLLSHEEHLRASQEREQKELDNNYALVKKEYELTKPLVQKGAASDVEVLRLEREMADKQQQIDAFLSRALQDLNAAKGELLTVNASLEQYKDRLTRTTVRSPVKGIVKQIKITTVGGIAQPGMELMEIVPIEDTLLVEVQIKPKDIGFLRVGQPAVVKISTYDFSIYGGFDGKVEQISADSITNQKGESYYIARIRTDKNYLLDRRKSGQLHIAPGMMASVDVLTGRKSVLDYLLKPIFKAKETALRER